MNLSVIIPNYNGEKLLTKNLPRVLEVVKEYKKGKVEIIIPDDPSTDNSAKVIEEFINSINEKNIVGKTTKNRNKNEAGFSKNVNRGVDVSTGEILILLNSDVSPRKDFLSPLLKHFEDDSVFAVGCLNESVENGKLVPRGRGIGKFKRGFFIHQKGEENNTTTLWVSGGSGAFRRKIWEKLKGFDTIYDPFYWEDIDLSYRALKSGYKVLFERESVVRHEHEEGVIQSGFRASYIKKISYRNQFIFIWKNFTDQSLIVDHILWLPYNFISALLRADGQFFSGFYLALLKFSQVTTSRTSAKKYFVRGDLEILKDYKV